MSDLPLFLGRFHPVLVHLPIGLLVAAGCLQAWSSWRRRRGAPSVVEAAAIGPMLGFAAAGAVLAAGAGYLLGTNGGYGGEVFERHRILGLGLAVSAVVTAVTRRVASRRPGGALPVVYTVLLVHTLALLVGVGHLGGVLTHGEGYLTAHAPAPLRALITRLAPEAKGGEADGPPEQEVVFEALVEPILQSRCVSCHAGERPEGGLRLDGIEGILAGGDHGPVVSPERPESSELWRRVSLPGSHADVMPPRGRRPVTAAEGALVQWWIAAGASFEATLGEVEVAPDVRDVVEAIVGPLPLDGPTLPPAVVDPPSPGGVATAEAEGFVVRPIADGLGFVQVYPAKARDAVGDAELGALEPLAPHVVWLDLRGTGVTDVGLTSVSRLLHLVRLDLSRTGVTDAGLAHLEGLAFLESLNLYGTAVADGGLRHLEAVPRLRRLYLWRTATTADGIDDLRAALPDLEVEAGSESPRAAAGER